MADPGLKFDIVGRVTGAVLFRCQNCGSVYASDDAHPPMVCACYHIEKLSGMVIQLKAQIKELEGKTPEAERARNYGRP